MIITKRDLDGLRTKNFEKGPILSRRAFRDEALYTMTKRVLF